MAKKDKKKKKNKSSNVEQFNVMLNKHKDEIELYKDEKKTTLEKVTSESAKNVKASPFDGVIPVPSTESAKDKKVDFHLSAHYSSPIYKLFELSLGSKVPHTLIMTIDVNDVDLLFHPFINPTITSLYEKSNLYLILNKAEKQRSKLQKWSESEPEEEYDMFVMNIPDIALFTESIVDGKAKAIFFNLVIQVVKAKKPIGKLKKKNSPKLEDLCRFIIKCTMENIKNYGCTTIVTAINDNFSPDYDAVIQNWGILLDADESFAKVVNAIHFTVRDSNGYAITSNGVMAIEEKRHKA